MNFTSVEKIAAAVLYEGYILYPYRSTAIKNRQRWNFGTLYPRIYAEAQCPQEPFRLVSECLLVPGANPSLDIKISFLQLLPQRRTSSDLADPSLDWDEAIERTSDHCDLSLIRLLAAPLSLRVNPAPDLAANLSIQAHGLTSGACRLHLELQNISPLSSGTEARRDEALPQSFVSAHLLLGLTGGDFISLLEPPSLYAADANACTNTGVFPVLAGDEPDRSILLLSPIILYDYPKTSPESAGDYFDGTEMDEMLALRVLTLTDAEKNEMRNGDPRARQILERTEALTGEEMLKVHGIVRPDARNPRRRPMNPDMPDGLVTDWNPFAEEKVPPESVLVFGVNLRVGDRIRISPRKSADIMDLALTGKLAIIEAIEQDFEGQIQFAVVFDDDPGREFGMMRQPGHRFFFGTEEVEPYIGNGRDALIEDASA